MNPAYEFNVRDRVEDSRGRWQGEITAVRYNVDRSVMWVDVTTGGSIG